MDKFVRKSDGFIIAKGILKQTELGADHGYKWFQRLNQKNAVSAFQTHPSTVDDVDQATPISIGRKDLNLPQNADIQPTASTSKGSVKQVRETGIVHKNDNQAPTKSSEQFPTSSLSGICSEIDKNEKHTQVDLWLSESEHTSVIPKNSDNLQFLAKHFDEFDSRYAYFLVSSRLKQASSLLNLMNVPWLKVFDFDVNSRSEGLLSSVEQNLTSKKKITISTSADSVQPISEKAIDWFFTLGFSDIKNTIFDGQPLQWYMSQKTALERQCSDIANFCICHRFPVFVILWYVTDFDTTQCLDWFLSCLYPSLGTTAKVILCINQFPNQTDPLNLIIDKYQLKGTTEIVGVDNVCQFFQLAKIPQALPPGTVRLPKEVSAENPHSSGLAFVELSKDVLWIQQYIELLPIESLDEKQKSEDAGRDFVKGGTITWNDLASGNIAVDRDNQSEVYDKLKTEIIDGRKSFIMKLFHAPGGGGTTFARQLLWYLHNDVPCGVVLPNHTLSIAHLVECVEFLFDKTLLPIVLLVDGRSDFEVKQLHEQCRFAVVILHVQRHIGDMSKSNPAPHVRCLPGNVSLQEAQKLTKLYSQFSPKSANALEKLTLRYSNETRYMFEYGLTAFNNEFKGVKKYVSGYLQLKTSFSTARIEDLQPWQKVVGFLALVSYFGQGSLDRQVFHQILTPSQQYSFVNISDLPFSAQQFILEFNGEWKISYYVIAKEILEQILSRYGTGSSKRLQLSVEACANLHVLVIAFIRMLRNVLKGNCSDRVLKTLSDTILRRDYGDLGMDLSDANDRRHKLSRLLEHISESENQIVVLRELTEAFPQYSEFHAHLGRLHTFSCNFNEAEKSLSTALSMRIKEQPSCPDNSRGRILHMFGFALLRKARKLGYTDFAEDDVVYSLLSIVTRAIQYFADGRRYATYNLSYGYIGEVRARLLIAEHVHCNYPNGCLGAFDGSLKNLRLSEFIRESHAVCDRLLSECQHYTLDAELKKIKDYYESVQNFNKFFKRVTNDLEIWLKTENNVEMHRSEIASIKMACSKSNSKYSSVDNLLNKDDILKIIQLHEKSIHQILLDNNLKSVSVSVEILELFDAIRHPLTDDCYPLATIIQTVEQWESRNEMGYASYYLYIICFIFAVYSSGKSLGTMYNRRCEGLRRKFRARDFWNLKRLHSIEWLSNHDDLTMRKVVSRDKMGVWDNEKRFWKNPNTVKLLQVCTGTIIRSSNPLSGYITLDVPNPSSRYNVEVYFVPKLYNLTGKRFADKSLRVEFFIGFDTVRGAEAFEIRELKRKICTNCNMMKEIITLNQEGVPKCFSCIKTTQT
ncbi:unnamed protein product [Clavelina lepadiformis]